MPKIVINRKTDQALKKVAPPYLRCPTHRVNWAIDELLRVKGEKPGTKKKEQSAA